MALIDCKECGREMSSRAKTCPRCGASNTRYTILNIIGYLLSFLIIVIFVDYCSSTKTSNSPQEENKSSLGNIAQETPVQLSPYGELANIFNLGSDYTDVQRENKTKEIKGKIVQWSLPVYEIARSGDGYRVQTQSGQAVGTVIHITPSNDYDKKFIEELKTGDIINFKGRIKGVSLRHVEIESAILISEHGNQPQNESEALPKEVPAPPPEAP